MALCFVSGAFATTDISSGGLVNGYAPECVEDVTGVTSGFTNFNAKWSTRNWTISYLPGDSNNEAAGGTAATGTTSSTTATSGERVSLAVNGFTLTGFDFDKWVCSDGNDDYEFANGALVNTWSIASNLTCTAYWKPKEYVITYDCGTVSAGGNTFVASGVVQSQTVEYNNAYILNNGKGCVLVGYAFNGWSCTNGLSGALLNGNPAYGRWNILNGSSCVATWTASVDKHVTYSCGTGSGNPPVDSNLYGTNASVTTLSNTCTKTGNNFVNWDCGGVSVNAGSSFTIMADTVCTAQWDTASYSVTYDCDGNGTAPVDNTQYNYNTSVTTLANTCAKTGHDFDGWSCAGSTVNAGGNFTIVGNTTCTARWTPSAYQITFAGGDTNNNGTGTAVTTVAMSAQTVHYGDTNVQLSANTFATPGYSFDEWSCNYGGQTPITLADTGTINTYNYAHDMVCTAKWTQDQYHVTYDCNNGIGTTSQSLTTYTYGTSVTPSYSCSNTGYTFSGWVCANQSVSNGGSFSITGNTTCVAQWTGVTYNITYVKGNASATGTTSATTAVYGSSATLATNGFSLTGYDFDLWECEDSGSNITAYFGSGQVVNPWTYAADLTCTAQWTQSTTNYTVSFNCGSAPAGTVSTFVSGGQAPASESYRYNQAYVLPDNAGTCSLPGYHFNGWSCTNNLVSPSGTWNIVNDSVCSATWIGNDIDLTWYGDTSANNGTVMAEVPDCTYDATFNLPSSPSKNGYSFLGWTVVPQYDFSALSSSRSTNGIEAWGISFQNESMCLYSYYNNNTTTQQVSVDNSFCSGLRGAQYNWKADFGYGTVYGQGKLSTTVGVGAYGVVGNPQNLHTTVGSNDYCWCQVTGIKLAGDDTIYKPATEMPWVYRGSGGHTCPILCARMLMGTEGFRSNAYGL